MAIAIFPGKFLQRSSSVKSVIPFPSVGEPKIVTKPGLRTTSTTDSEPEIPLTRPVTRQGFRKSLDKIANVLQRKKRPSEAKLLTSTHISLPRPLAPVPLPFSIPSLVRSISHTMTEPSTLRSICRRLPPLPACPNDWDISSPIRLQKFSPVVILFSQLWALKQNHRVPETFFDALQALYQYLDVVDEFIRTAHPLDAKTVYNCLPPAVKLHACRTEFITGHLERLHKRVGVARALKEDFHSRMRELGVEQTREWIIRKRRNEATKTQRRMEKLFGHTSPRNLYDAVRDRNCCVVARSRASLAEYERWHNRAKALEEWVDCNIRLETKSIPRGTGTRFKSPLHHVETLL